VRVSWLLLTIASAFLLGLYDYLKKVALSDNAVMPALFGSVATGALVWLPFIAWSAFSPDTLPLELFHVSAISWHGHLLLFAKAALVGASWLCGYYGLEALPLSVAAPIRATAPLWTITMAILLFNESPSAKQVTGMAVIFISFFAFTLVSRREGIRFVRDKAVFYMIAATLLGAASSLYDKFLLQNTRLTPGQVQAWFSVYTALLMTPPLLLWLCRRKRHPFHWRWSIPLIGLTLLAADLLYFTAIAQPGALISLISPVRRSSVVVSFLLGIIVLREKQVGPKGWCVAGIVTGVILLS
jgi:bacterial/archaeal transporter family protein